MYVYDDNEIEHLALIVAKSVYRTLNDDRVSHETRSLPEVTIETITKVTQAHFAETLKHCGVMPAKGVFDKALKVS